MLNATQSLLEQLLLDLKSDSAWLGGASIGLYTNNLTPAPNINFANLVEANYDGYNRAAAGFSSVPFVDTNGLISLEGNSNRFQPSDTVTPNTVYGLFLIGNSTANLIGIEPFNAPIPLSGPLTQVTIIPRVGLLQTGAYGFSVVAQ